MLEEESSDREEGGALESSESSSELLRVAIAMEHSYMDRPHLPRGTLTPRRATERAHAFLDNLKEFDPDYLRRFFSPLGLLVVEARLSLNALFGLETASPF